MDGEPIERGAYHDQVDEEGLPAALGHFAHGVVTFESEPALLKRCGMLLPGEAERVKAAAYRPRAFKERSGAALSA